MDMKGEEEEEFIFRSQIATNCVIPKDVTLPQFVLQNAEAHAQTVALVDAVDGREFSYGDVYKLTRYVASGLLLLGVCKGDVVVVLLPNMPEYCILVFGIMSAGAVFSGANPFAHRSELEKQVSDSDAKLIITDATSYEKIRALDLPVVVVGQGAPPAGCIPADRLFGGCSGAVPEVVVSQDDVCALPYSSGTTGMSKGVMLTHRNIIANLCSTLFDLELISPGDNVTLGLMPFFHIYGITGICCATLRTKGKVVVMSRFELRLFLTTLLKYKVTFAPIVPPIVLALVKNPMVQEFDLTQLKLESVMTAAAPLAPDLLKAFHTKFPDVYIQEAYGLTEHSCITLSHCAPGHARGNAKNGSVGFIVPNLEVKFVHPETGKSLPPNTPGEICVRSQCVMKGYLKNPDATNATIDKDGWLHTGDIGYIDNDGDVFIVDRIKELIKYKGFQVPPAELEAILISHHDIVDVAVIAIPDEEAGELPAACVVRAPNSQITKDEVIDFVSSKVASYKKVRLVWFVDSIPKSLSGKILRRTLRETLLNEATNGA